MRLDELAGIFNDFVRRGRNAALVGIAGMTLLFRHNASAQDEDIGAGPPPSVKTPIAPGETWKKDPDYQKALDIFNAQRGAANTKLTADEAACKHRFAQEAAWRTCDDKLKPAYEARGRAIRKEEDIINAGLEACPPRNTKDDSIHEFKDAAYGIRQCEPKETAVKAPKKHPLKTHARNHKPGGPRKKSAAHHRKRR